MNPKGLRFVAAVLAIALSVLTMFVPEKAAHADTVSMTVTGAQAAVRLPAESLPRAATETEKCGVSNVWSSEMTHKFTKNVSLKYWSAQWFNVSYICYRLHRGTIRKGSYLKIGIDGVGKHTSGKTKWRLVILVRSCVQMSASLFKFKDKNKEVPKTYWKENLTYRGEDLLQCG